MLLLSIWKLLEVSGEESCRLSLISALDRLYISRKIEEVSEAAFSDMWEDATGMHLIKSWKNGSVSEGL